MENLLIITYGRSGSTLLQGLLNQIPRTLIRGENHFFIRPLGQSYKLMCNCHFQSLGGTESTSAWFGSQELSPVNFLRDTRMLVENQLLGSHQSKDIDRLGFKEIQYIDMDKVELFEHLDFLRLIFPNHRFIVHTRNHESVAKSGWWAKEDPAEVLARLTSFECTLAEYFSSVNPNRVMYSTYENIINDADGFCIKVSEFLQTEVPSSSLKWALSQRHSLKSEEWS